MTPSLVVVFSFFSFLSCFLSFLICFLSSFDLEESRSLSLLLDDLRNPAAEAVEARAEPIALKEEVGPEDVDEPFDDEAGLGLELD